MGLEIDRDDYATLRGELETDMAFREAQALDELGMHIEMEPNEVEIANEPNGITESIGSPHADLEFYAAVREAELAHEQFQRETAVNDPLSAIEALAARSTEQEAVSPDFVDYFHDREGFFEYEDAYPEVNLEQAQEVTVDNAQVESFVDTESSDSPEVSTSETSEDSFAEANADHVDMMSESTDNDNDFAHSDDFNADDWDTHEADSDFDQDAFDMQANDDSTGDDYDSYECDSSNDGLHASNDADCGADAGADGGDGGGDGGGE